MKYIEYVNEQIRNTVKDPENLVLFGQNINAGSRLGGLTKGLSVNPTSKIINSTNSENSLCGFGFGLMLNGISSVFFMKQLDFLLLGIDHLVNTYNNIRSTINNPKSSFTIMPIIMDNGYQGSQSSLNNFADFCSIARIPGYTISTKAEAKKLISTKLISPGFRIIGVSARLFKEEIISAPIIYENTDSSLIQYSNGMNVTIVCFNLSFPIGWNILQNLKKDNIKSSIFNITTLTPINWEEILENVRETKKIIIIDDSKSQNLACENLISFLHDNCDILKKIILKRKIENNWLYPISDEMVVDYQKIKDSLHIV